MADPYIDRLIRKWAAPSPKEPRYGVPGAYNYPKAIADTLFALCQKEYSDALEIAYGMDINYMVEVNPMVEHRVPVDTVNVLYYISSILAFMANDKQSNIDSSMRRLASRHTEAHSDLVSINQEAAKGKWVYAKVADQLLYKDTDLHELL